MSRRKRYLVRRTRIADDRVAVALGVQSPDVGIVKDGARFAKREHADREAAAWEQTGAWTAVVVDLDTED